MPVVHDPILVVDAADRPLAAMPAAAVLAQGLLHRRVLGLLADAQGRVLVRRHHGVWQPPAVGPVGALESADEALARLLPPELAQAEHELVIIAPPTARLRAFVWVFTVRATPPSSATAMDLDELAALVARYPDQVAPELIHAWEAGVLRL